MSFDVIHPLKRATGIFIANIAAYLAGIVIAVLGSVLIVTVAPFIYGLYYMAIKGTRGEEVKIKDVFYGFSSTDMFTRTWVGFIGFGFVFFIVISLSLIGRLLDMAVLFSFLSLVVCFILLIFLYFTPYIYVMTPSKNIIYAIKESVRIGKTNIVMTILTILVAAIFLIFLVTAPIGLVFAVYVLKGLEPSIKDSS